MGRPNGMGFSPGLHTLYVTDSAKRWSLAEAKALLGYIPHSEHAPGTPNGH